MTPRHPGGWLWVALAAGIVANGLRLRQRLCALRALVVEPGLAADDDFVVLHPRCIRVPDEVVAAASRYADAEGLDVVDLIPADLSPDQVLDLARAVDTATYRATPLAAGRGARHAVLVRRQVVDRARVGDPPDWAAFVRLSDRLKQHAARATDIVVAPGLKAVTPKPDERLAELRALYSNATPVALALPAVRSVLLIGGLVLSPGWGAAALAAFLAQPYLVASGTPLAPKFPGSAGSATQRVTAPFTLLRRAHKDRTPDAADPIEVRRAEYTRELAGGVQRFLEPRRDTCPWCESMELVERLRTPDLNQFKPGEFAVDECTACGLLFQNPRLTLEGLDFYYRDFYDGLGEGGVEFLFAQAEASYRARVDLVCRHTSPTTWLDVGTGYGHFCLIAQGVLPDTRFDGLDMGSSVEEAQRRGWVEHAHRGLFPELAEDLKGRYDVISMYHYLEHTLDPRTEIEAVHRALPPGGHVLIEVPDPESYAARLFGRYWMPWLQPQHLQFLSAAHLTSALEAEGFSIVEVERGRAHQPMDLAGAAWQWAAAKAPPPRVPWRDPPTARDRLQRGAVLTATVPFMLAGLLADRLMLPLIRARGAGWSNAFRILARRD